MKPFIDIAIDIETLSRRDNAAIISIAAVPFSRDPYTPLLLSNNPFHIYINASTCALHGMHFDMDTVVWWQGMNDEAKSAMLEGQRVNTSIGDALQQFVNYLHYIKQENGCEIMVWCQGTDFDLPILESALRNILGLTEMPWAYNHKRDARTFVEEMAPILFAAQFKPGSVDSPYDYLPTYPEEHTSHDALSDATRLAHNVHSVFNQLKQYE